MGTFDQTWSDLMCVNSQPHGKVVILRSSHFMLGDFMYILYTYIIIYIYTHMCTYMYTIIYDMFIPSDDSLLFLSQLKKDTGHQIIEMLNADRTLRIEMATWRLVI